MSGGKRFSLFLKILVLASGILAFAGWLEYGQVDGVVDAVWLAFYRTMQTYLFNANIESDTISLTLKIASILAPLSLAGTLLYTAFSTVRVWLGALYVRLVFRGHIIIAGPLDFCLTMLESSKEDKTLRAVLMVPPDTEIAEDLLLQQRLWCMPGSMTQKRDWLMAGIQKARAVLISPDTMCDFQNIVMEIGRAAGAHNPKPKIQCALDSMETVGVLSSSAKWSNVEGLSIHYFQPAHLVATGAAEALAPHFFLPTEYLAQEQAHLLFLGFTEMTLLTLIEAAQLYHYPSFKNLRATIISDDPEKTKLLLSRHPGLAEVVDISVIDSRGKSMALPERSPLPYLVLGFPENPWQIPELARTWRRFLVLNEPEKGREIPMVFFVPVNAGHEFNFKSFEQEWPDLKFSVTTISDYLDLDHVINNSEVIDSIACQINASYHLRFGGREWEDLSDREKEFNRRSARHLKIKLFFAGYTFSDDLSLPVLELPAFDKKMKSLLARLEHRRWCSEKLLDGYIPGTFPADREGKAYYKEMLRIHQDIRPFEELSREDIAKDENSFEDLNAIIASVLQKKRLVKLS